MIERKHILVLEGGTDLLGGQRDLLEKNRYQVSVVSSPRKALSQLKTTNYSLILVDKRLSPQHADVVRLLARTESTPKIVVSCDKRFSGIPQWMRAGAGAYLYAPFEYTELRHALDRVLNRMKSEKDLASLRQDLSSRDSELREYRSFGNALGASLRQDEVDTIILNRVRLVTGAEASLLYALDHSSGGFVCRKSLGIRKSDSERLRFHAGIGLAGAVVEQGKPVLLDPGNPSSGFRMTTGQQAFYKGRSAMCVPVRGSTGVLGAVEAVGRKRKPAFTENDLLQFARLMDQAAWAMERASAYRRTADMAMTDDLTGLFNLRYLTSVIDTEVERGQRYGVVVSVIFMDVDHFKDVNDSKGHIVGSKVLVEVADVLRQSLRTVDIVARYGGDEFVAVLPQTSLDAAFSIAERLRKTIERSIFLGNEGYALRLTASFGVTAYPEAAKSKEELLRMADEAMYMAKTRSRNSVYAMRY